MKQCALAALYYENHNGAYPAGIIMGPSHLGHTFHIITAVFSGQETFALEYNFDERYNDSDHSHIQYVGSATYLHLFTPNTSIGDLPSAEKYDRCVTTPDMPCDPAIPGTGEYANSFSSARSFHPGGVNVVFADGHVDFVTDVIELWIWRCLGKIDDGKTLPSGFQNM